MSWECPLIFLLSGRGAAKGGDSETGSQAFEGPVCVCARMYVRVHVLVAHVYDMSACRCVCKCVQALAGSEFHFSARPSHHLPVHGSRAQSATPSLAQALAHASTSQARKPSWGLLPPTPPSSEPFPVLSALRTLSPPWVSAPHLIREADLLSAGSLLRARGRSLGKDNTEE